MSEVVLWQLAPSFNSRKVRYALDAKSVVYKTVEVGPEQVPRVVELSGQPLTPMLQHGIVAMFDSGAIVRYVDANFPGRRLFSAEVDGMRIIEEWERRARSELLTPFQTIMGELRSGRMGADALAAGREAFLAGATAVEDALGDSGWLFGDDLGAADVFCACYLAYGFLDEATVASRPPLAWCREHLTLTDTHPKLASWWETFARFDAIEH